RRVGVEAPDGNDAFQEIDELDDRRPPLRVAGRRDGPGRLVQQGVREPLGGHLFPVHLDTVAPRDERVQLARLAVHAHAARLDQLVRTAARRDTGAGEISVETHAVIVAARAPLHLVDALDVAGARRAARLARACRGW